jgi:hypothetical protein
LAKSGIEGDFVMWDSLRELRELKIFYKKLKDNPDSLDDEVVITTIENSFWGTNCWAYVEQSLAIIAPACLYKPHLTKELIQYPIDAMIAGGLEDCEQIINFGVGLAEKEKPYVELTEDGKFWLKNIWPNLSSEINQVFSDLKN